jgi:hypothetical protein
MRDRLTTCPPIRHHARAVEEPYGFGHEASAGFGGDDRWQTNWECVKFKGAPRLGWGAFLFAQRNPMAESSIMQSFTPEDWIAFASAIVALGAAITATVQANKANSIAKHQFKVNVYKAYKALRNYYVTHSYNTVTFEEVMRLAPPILDSEIYLDDDTFIELQTYLHTILEMPNTAKQIDWAAGKSLIDDVMDFQARQEDQIAAEAVLRKSLDAKLKDFARLA